MFEKAGGLLAIVFGGAVVVASFFEPWLAHLHLPLSAVLFLLYWAGRRARRRVPRPLARCGWLGRIY
jgi:hypothetical protein